MKIGKPPGGLSACGHGSYRELPAFPKSSLVSGLRGTLLGRCWMALQIIQRLSQQQVFAGAEFRRGLAFLVLILLTFRLGRFYRWLGRSRGCFHRGFFGLPRFAI